MGDRRLLAVLLLVLCYGTGCIVVTTQKLSGHREDPVQTVRWPAGRGLESSAQRAQSIANEVYPRICELLYDDPSAVPKHLTITLRPLNRNTGQTFYRTQTSEANVSINANYFRPGGLHWDPTNFARFDAVLVHELAHAAQRVTSTNVPGYWTEGIADYVRYKLGFSNSWYAAECTAEYPNYQWGYCCAAAFLLHVENDYGPAIVRRLSVALRSGVYSDAVFEEVTGRSLSELWSEFEQTSAYTASAARMMRLAKKLGYENGKPPQDIEAKFEAYVRGLPGGHQTADALRFVRTLGEQGKLPGFSKRSKPIFAYGERLTGSFIQPDPPISEAYPMSRTIYCYDSAADSIYFYEVIRVSAQSEWTIVKAWQTSRDRQVIRTFKSAH